MELSDSRPTAAVGVAGSDLPVGLPVAVKSPQPLADKEKGSSLVAADVASKSAVAFVKSVEVGIAVAGSPGGFGELEVLTLLYNPDIEPFILKADKILT